MRERCAVYDPEHLSVMGTILDEAVAALPEGMRTPANRMEIAKLILRRAENEVELASLMKLVAAVDAAA
jgi:hypothetical protein